MLECEYLVIGGGESGLMVAKELARYGKKTIIVEEKKLGGNYVHSYDLPKEVLLSQSIQYYSALNFLDKNNDRNDDKKNDDKNNLLLDNLKEKRSQIQQNILQEVAKEEANCLHNLQKISNITHLQGKVEIVSKTLAEVNSITERHLINFSHCVITVGKDIPVKPNIQGIETIPFIYENTIFLLPEVPQSLGIVGITPKTLEVAHIYANLGVSVQIFEVNQTNNLQKYLDNSAINYTYKKLFEKNVVIHPKTVIQSVQMDENRNIQLTDSVDQKRTVSHVFIPLQHEFSEHVLPGLNRVGIDFSSKGIKTDTWGQTKNSNFSALGECNSRTRSGNKHAIIHRFLEKHLGKTEFSLPGKFGLPIISSSPEPSAIETPVHNVRSQMPVSTIGLSENEAIGQYGPVAKTRSYYNQVTDSFIKVIYKKNSGEILGISLGGVYQLNLEALCVYFMENKVGVRDSIHFLKTYFAIQ